MFECFVIAKIRVQNLLCLVFEQSHSTGIFETHSYHWPYAALKLSMESLGRKESNLYRISSSEIFAQIVD